MQKDIERNQAKEAVGAAKRQYQPKPCPWKILKQGLYVRAVSDSSALWRDIQAVVHQQPIDQPDQFSGS